MHCLSLLIICLGFLTGKVLTFQLRPVGRPQNNPTSTVIKYHNRLTSLLRSTAANDPGPNHEKLGKLLTDAKDLGAVRFVVVGSGAILEAVGSFDNLRYADTPKGRLATVSTEMPCFECHLKLAEVKSVKNVVVEKFGRVLRITRFLGADGSTLLSAILHQPENINEDAKQKQIAAWEGFQSKYGDSVEL